MISSNRQEKYLCKQQRSAEIKHEAKYHGIASLVATVLGDLDAADKHRARQQEAIFQSHQLRTGV